MVKNLANKLGLNIYIYIYIIVAFLAVILISTGSTSALTSQGSVGFQFSFNSSLSISLSSADLVIPHLTPGNYASSNTITVNVSTNNSYGHTLMAKVGDKNNPNLANNNLVNTESSDSVFASLATTDKLTLANFDDNKWGYTTASTIDAGTTTYSGLLYNIDTIINATKTSTGIPMDNTYPGTNTTNFTIAARAGDTQASGKYTNVINFRGVANINTDVTINDLRYMQDTAKLTDVERQAVISSMTTGTTYQLQDSRDDTTYSIAKLKDGNIWMQDNLALDPATLKAGVTLDSTNTNLSYGSTFTLPNSTTTGFDNVAASYTTEAINTAYKNTSQPLAVGQSGTGKIGVYYNYCTATAGTYCMDRNSGSGNATSDICPKGWRLPTGGASGEFQALKSQYASDGEFALALRTPLSGLFVDGSARGQGSSGYFWSSTYYSVTDMYRLLVYAGGVNPQSSGSRHYGFSVRCVYDATPDMQNVTTSELATLMPSIGDTAMLNDSRDGTIYNIGRLADNRYWMLDNLALDKTTLKSGVTLDSSNTNLSAGKTFTLPNSTKTGFEDAVASYTTKAINTESKNTSQSLAVGQSGTGKIGVYYNYCAATAGTYCFEKTHTDTNNATNDICPKGWRLPTGGASGEFQALRNQYSSAGEFALALRTPLSGNFDGGSVHDQGNYGYFWSSTYYNATSMYSLGVNATGIHPQNIDNRRGGFSVRCVKQ